MLLLVGEDGAEADVEDDGRGIGRVGRGSEGGVAVHEAEFWGETKDIDIPGAPLGKVVAFRWESMVHVEFLARFVVPARASVRTRPKEIVRYSLSNNVTNRWLLTLLYNVVTRLSRSLYSLTQRLECLGGSRTRC